MSGENVRAPSPQPFVVVSLSSASGGDEHTAESGHTAEVQSRLQEALGESSSTPDDEEAQQYQVEKRAGKQPVEIQAAFAEGHDGVIRDAQPEQSVPFAPIFQGEVPIDVFMSNYRVNGDVYSMTYMIDPLKAKEDDLSADYMRTQDNGIVLYPAQFECGFRLPLDSFIVKFLDLHRILPGDLPPNSVRVLVAFIAVFRLLGYEPTLEVFDLWYFTQVSRGKFSVKCRIKQPEILTEAKNKHEGWFRFPILVENRLG